MCGINGYALVEGQVDRRVVQRMNDQLHHRGPDEGGIRDLGFAALGMRRLSIVDLEGGHQPMTTDGARLTIVYNGELYDYREMRGDLERRGRRFRTASDTEVALEAWAHAGPDCLPALNGMFAFAIADSEERSLVLVRDPLGIKPLYYWLGQDGELVFSSELKSLLAHPRVPRALDRRSLAMLLVDRCVSDPWTMFEGIHQLPPAHWLSWRNGRTEVHRYWELTLAPEPMQEAEAVEELQRLLRESVRSQLVADVPVGVFLSGGIDSSTVAAHAAAITDGPVHSFNVGFDSADFDESVIAEEVAKHLGTEHHRIRVRNAGFDPAVLDEIVDHVGQPLGDLSCIPTRLVAKLAREQVKVILSGDGGDELFGGYDHVFWAARVRRVSERTPALVRRLGAAVLAGVSPVASGAAAERTRRARKGLALTFCEPPEQLRRMMSLWSEEEVAGLLAERSELPLRPWFLGDERSLEGLPPEQYAMAVLARTYMSAAILTKVDRMSMAASLEVRVPLLDLRVVEFARRCPVELKVRGREGKYLLRRAGRGILPEVVFSHPKQGFGLPLADWFNGEFWDLLEELYRPGSAAAALFEPERLQSSIQQGRAAHRQGRRISSQAAATRVWLLAQLGRWMERFEVTA